MLPKAPEAELRKDQDPLIEALFNYQVIYVEAYVVHVDMVSQNEVAFKLTPETIESLVEYHKDVHSVDTAASYLELVREGRPAEEVARGFRASRQQIRLPHKRHGFGGLGGRWSW